MTDVEIITELNHRAARERELGERWDKIIRQRKRKSELLKASEAFCFSIGCVLRALRPRGRGAAKSRQERCAPSDLSYLGKA